VPVVLGVPENTPVVGLMLSPGGTLPLVLHVMVPGSPVCENVCENVLPTIMLLLIVPGDIVPVGQLTVPQYWVDPEQGPLPVAVTVKQ
jgi:hypothetical protein